MVNKYMTKKINIPTFEATIIFMYDVDRKALKKYAKRLNIFEIKDIDDEFSGITMDVGDMTWIIYIPDTDANDFIWLIRTLSHEANHVILQLMEKVGVHDDETICYA